MTSAARFKDQAVMLFLNERRSVTHDEDELSWIFICRYSGESKGDCKKGLKSRKCSKCQQSFSPILLLFLFICKRIYKIQCTFGQYLKT